MRLYIGAYVSAPIVEKSEKGSAYFFCPTSEAHGTTSARHATEHEDPQCFCQQCGSPMTLVRPVVKSKVFLSPDDFDQDADSRYVDRMSDLQSCVGASGNWVPNSIRVPFCFYGQIETPSEELTSEKIKLAKGLLAERYADFLSYMEARHGVTLIVKYGVLPY